MPACVLAASLSVLPACVREPLPEVCPVIEVGELVISELRADQAGSDDNDSFGHYIEIYNAAGKTVDLQGLHIVQREAGGDVVDILIRESIEVEAGAYAVVGPGGDEQDEEIPAWIHYALRWDISGGNPDPDLEAGESFSYPKTLFGSTSAFIELEACGVLIDDMFYGPEVLGSRELPDSGSLACGNADSPPSASDNDDALEGCWCIDDQQLDGQPFGGVGLPGSPGSANRCP